MLFSVILRIKNARYYLTSISGTLIRLRPSVMAGNCVLIRRATKLRRYNVAEHLLDEIRAEPGREEHLFLALQELFRPIREPAVR